MGISPATAASGMRFPLRLDPPPPAGRRRWIPLSRERLEGPAARRDSDQSLAHPGPAAPTEAYLRGQDFLRRLIAGDPGTRNEFVSQYGALVRFAIAAVLRQRDASMLAEELDDLTQSVLLSFFDRDCRRLKMYEGRNQASFATFVRVCATRQTLDHLRSEQRRPRTVSSEGNEADGTGSLAGLPDPRSGPEDCAAASEGIELLRQAVAQLAPREQLLVRLHFVEGLDTAEVASVLGVSENAVHVLKSRIKVKLRDRIDLGWTSHE